MLKWAILGGGTILLIIALVILKQFFPIATLVIGWVEGVIIMRGRQR